MEHLLGLHFTGDIAPWYQGLTQTLYERFGGKPLHTHIPPHVTVIPPFDEAHLPAVRACVARWKQEGNEGPWTVSLDGFGSFEQGVVFGRIEMPPSTREAMERLRAAVFAVPPMPEPFFPEWHPHVSLARLPSAELLPSVWEYVQTLPAPHFMMNIAGITLFRRANDGWHHLDETFAPE